MPVPTVVGGTLKLWTMPPIETGSAATLNDITAWPSAIAIIGIHDSRASAPVVAGAVVVLIDFLPVDLFLSMDAAQALGACRTSISPVLKRTSPYPGVVTGISRQAAP